MKHILFLPLESRLIFMMSMSDLASGRCVPCKGTKPLSKEIAESRLRQLPGWTLSNGVIEKEFRFKSYMDGLDFAYAIGKIAEEQDHHPDILVKWRRVRLTFSTHVIKGLSQNDFIMAAKSELEYQKYSS
jgi:4a-hydroxytetrahydrobiopterin dehydratase